MAKDLNLRVDITIITPTYNRANLLLRVWNSIKDQTPTFRWIVIDDGSNDNTTSVISEISDERVFYHLLPFNQGVNVARNTGFKYVNSKYVIFLDSDDELLPGSLARMVELMDKTSQDIGAIIFPVIAYNTGERTQGIKDELVVDESYLVCNRFYDLGEFFHIFRSEVINIVKYPEDLISCEGLFYLSVSKYYKFLMKDEPVRVYYRQGDNLSDAASLIRRSVHIAQYYERILEDHRSVLVSCPQTIKWYLMKIIYKYAIGKKYKLAWKAYLELINKFPSLKDKAMSFAFLMLSINFGASYEYYRLKSLNKNFGKFE